MPVNISWQGHKNYSMSLDQAGSSQNANYKILHSLWKKKKGFCRQTIRVFFFYAKNKLSGQWANTLVDLPSIIIQLEIPEQQNLLCFLTFWLNSAEHFPTQITSCSDKLRQGVPGHFLSKHKNCDKNIIIRQTTSVCWELILGNRARDSHQHHS